MGKPAHRLAMIHQLERSPPAPMNLPSQGTILHPPPIPGHATRALFRTFTKSRQAPDLAHIVVAAHASLQDPWQCLAPSLPETATKRDLVAVIAYR